MLDFSNVTALSFDCYGTLIDWESGILSSLRPMLFPHGINEADRDLLALYGQFERRAQEQTPFVNYDTVLRDVARSFCNHFSIDADTDSQGILADSMGNWPVFPDTTQALISLKSRFNLAVISNVDDDMFRVTQERLGVSFDWIITSEQVRSYKPTPENFHFSRRVMGVELDQHVHVAQSLYHDIAPASALGWKTVWVNRIGAASTPLVESQPELEVPDMESLASLVASGYSK